MLYAFIKTPVRLALAVFCRRIQSNPPGPYRNQGPLLIVANHPNSFLDAIIIGSRFSRPVHFLARGDAFNKPWHRTLLGWLNMIPVYRLSEGKEKLGLNACAFKRCSEILTANGIVLIFIEGICVNSHQLQPFKKGAARIALENRYLPGFRVLPIGIAYSSLHGIGKTVNLETGNSMTVTDTLPYAEEAHNMRHFNKILFEKLQPLIQVPQPAIRNQTKNILLLIPAFLGYALYILPYTIIRAIVARNTRGTVFYDSVLFACLLLLYPVYWLLILILLFVLQVPFLYQLLAAAALPVLARTAVSVWKK